MNALLAVPSQDALELMHSLLKNALSLVCLDVSADFVRTKQELMLRVDEDVDDVIFLDWQLVEADTPALVTEILQRNPKLRVIVLLPMHLRQYRQMVWDAGACNSMPKEHMDQEWLSSVLCLIQRAMQREERAATQAREMMLRDV